MTRDDPRHDRTGDEDPPDAHHCADGWMPGHTLDDDQPRPCLICRPHLALAARRRRLYGNDPGGRPQPTDSENRPTARENQ